MFGLSGGILTFVLLYSHKFKRKGKGIVFISKSDVVKNLVLLLKSGWRFMNGDGDSFEKDLHLRWNWVEWLLLN